MTRCGIQIAPQWYRQIKLIGEFTSRGLGWNFDQSIYYRSYTDFGSMDNFLIGKSVGSYHFWIPQLWDLYYYQFSLNTEVEKPPISSYKLKSITQAPPLQAAADQTEKQNSRKNTWLE